MAGYLPARLIPLLGVSTLDDIDETSLQRLIGVDEAPDLEFKGENYEASDGKRKELAYDIADRANHVGGLIIVGIEEEAGRASSLSPVEPDPHGAEETTRIYQIVGSKIHPRVSSCGGSTAPRSPARSSMLFRFHRATGLRTGSWSGIRHSDGGARVPAGGG